MAQMSEEPEIDFVDRLLEMLTDGDYELFMDKKNLLVEYGPGWFFTIIQILSDDNDYDQSTKAETVVHFLLDTDLGLPEIDWTLVKCKHQDVFLWALYDDSVSVACAIIKNPNSRITITANHIEPIVSRCADVTEITQYVRPSPEDEPKEHHWNVYLSHIYEWLILNTPDELMGQLEKCVRKSAPKTYKLFTELKERRGE
jgi:hypothetical protein